MVRSESKHRSSRSSDECDQTAWIRSLYNGLNGGECYVGD